MDRFRREYLAAEAVWENFRSSRSRPSLLYRVYLPAIVIGLLVGFTSLAILSFADGESNLFKIQIYTSAVLFLLTTWLTGEALLRPFGVVMVRRENQIRREFTEKYLDTAHLLVMPEAFRQAMAVLQ